MNINFLDKTYPTDGCVILTSDQDGNLSFAAKHYDNLCGNIIKKALKNSNFSGKEGEVLFFTPTQTDISCFILLGVGTSLETFNTQTWVNLGGSAFAATEKISAKKVYFIEPEESKNSAAVSYFAEGFLLRSYKFHKYKTSKENISNDNIDSLSIISKNPSLAKDVFHTLSERVASIELTRDLVSEAPNVLYPESMANKIKELESTGLKIKILKPKDLKELGMEALLAVGQGSSKEARVVTLEWHGASKDKAPLAFVGKGVTFDTGGISLKAGLNMHEMKTDMGGAATVIGLLATLAKRKAKINAVGVVGLVENMPGSNAYRPGDVIKSMSGKTIEVLNTDAEGRVVLSDVLWYTQEKFKPKLLIDLATLTGAILIALGEEIAGLFANNNKLAQQLHEIGEATDEKVWQMPMHKLFNSHVISDIADIKNIGKKGLAGSVSAAKFLEFFIQDGLPWAHLDVAGVAWSDKPSYMFDKGATGFGVRLLDEFVKKHHEKA